MKGVLFTGGAAPEYKYIKKEIKEADIIVAADSGFDTAVKMGVKPDIVIGDMDSINHLDILEKYPPDRVLCFSEDKDKTDTELGLIYLQKNKYDEIVLIGGGGGRMDHFLGIVFLFDKDFSPAIWYTHSTRMQKITGRIQVPSMKGKTVSFFPAGKSQCRMKSEGLKWPLDNLLWSRGDMGLSNIATEDPFCIEVLEGNLLMVTQLEEEDN